jgi:hypothetical protein
VSESDEEADPEIFDFDTLAADPEIAPLLEFDPVPRKRVVDGAWTRQLQREFICRLADHGSARRACEEMGKNQTGVMKLYRSPLSASFRASWHGAVDLAKRRQAERAPLEYVSPGARPPTIDYRRKFAALPAPVGGDGGDGPSEEDTHEALGLDLLMKFARKLKQERTARLAGRIVEADFYLRQITFLEVAIELATGDLFQALAGLRRGGHELIDIADTPVSRILDNVRRTFWAMNGEPERPPLAPEDLLVDHGELRSQPVESTRGGIGISHALQRARFNDQHRRDAEAQARWEQRAYAEWEARQK